jgi:hypothetical protein
MQDSRLLLRACLSMLDSRLLSIEETRLSPVEDSSLLSIPARGL